jgi:hypothetical protein
LSTTIQIKRRVTGAPGAPPSLAAGEIAFNEVDGTLYYGAGNNSGLATTIIPIAGVRPDSPSDGQMLLNAVEELSRRLRAVEAKLEETA